MVRVFEYAVRVEYEDCDIGGDLFHSNYFNYCERARSHAIAGRGLPFKTWLQRGVALAIAHIECSFYATASLYDDLSIYTTWEEPRAEGKSLKVRQSVYKQKLDNFAEVDVTRQKGRIAQIDFVLVCVQGSDNKSIPIPDDIRAFL